jgi:xanthine/CO dehydrogenase XdhC/CoxF family maturation factor
MWNQLQTFVRAIPDLLTPKPMRVEVSLDEQLSEAIALAVKNSAFRTRLLDRPKQTLASLDIQIPPVQAVTVLESTPGQTFLVIPIMTDREVQILEAGLTSGRANRANRSRMLLQAGRDPDFRSRLLTNPNAVLTEAGFQISATATVTVKENSLEQLYLVIPFGH